MINDDSVQCLHFYASHRPVNNIPASKMIIKELSISKHILHSVHQLYHTFIGYE